MTTADAPLTPADQRFLLRWAASRRRGPLLYVLWVTLGFVLGLTGVCWALGNLLYNGLRLAEWGRWSERVPWAYLAGAVVGSVTGVLIRFDRNQERYAGLTLAERSGQDDKGGSGQNP